MTNAAMLLFAKNPSKFRQSATIKIGYFGDSDSDLLFQDEINGPFITIIDRLTEIVYLKYLKANISYNGNVREEKYFVPKDAFRDVIANAICNTKYNFDVPIQISVYNDKMYVFNVGRESGHFFVPF